MPVTRSQMSEVAAAKALVALKKSAPMKRSEKCSEKRPQRKAAIVARGLIKLCASSDNEDYSQ
jgi:hypothetical protein